MATQKRDFGRLSYYCKPHLPLPYHLGFHLAISKTVHDFAHKKTSHRARKLV